MNLHTQRGLLLLLVLSCGSALDLAAGQPQGAPSNQGAKGKRGLAGIASTLLSDIDTVIHAMDVVAPVVGFDQGPSAEAAPALKGAVPSEVTGGAGAGNLPGPSHAQQSVNAAGKLGAMSVVEPDSMRGASAKEPGSRDSAELAQGDALVKEAERAVSQLHQLQVEHPQDDTPHAAYEQAVDKVARAEQAVGAEGQPADPGLQRRAEEVLQDAEDRLRDAAVYEYHGARATAVHETGAALEEVQDAGRLLSALHLTAAHMATPVYVPRLVAALHTGLPALRAWASSLRNAHVFAAGSSDVGGSAPSDETRLMHAQALIDAAATALDLLRTHEGRDPHAANGRTRDAVRSAATAYSAAQDYLKSWEADTQQQPTGTAAASGAAAGVAQASSEAQAPDDQTTQQLGTQRAPRDASPASTTEEGKQTGSGPATHEASGRAVADGWPSWLRRVLSWLRRVLGWLGLGKQLVPPPPEPQPSTQAATPPPADSTAAPDARALYAEAEQAVLTFHAAVQQELVAVKKLLDSYGIHLDDAGGSGMGANTHAQDGSQSAQPTSTTATSTQLSPEGNELLVQASSGEGGMSSGVLHTLHDVADSLYEQVEAGVGAVKSAVTDVRPLLQAAHDAVVAAASTVSPHVAAATSGAPPEST